MFQKAVCCRGVRKRLYEGKGYSWQNVYVSINLFTLKYAPWTYYFSLFSLMQSCGTYFLYSLSTNLMKFDDNKQSPSHADMLNIITVFMLSNIQQPCLWKHIIGKKMKSLSKWKSNNWIKLKTLWQRTNCSLWAISLFATMFSRVVCCRGFKKCLFVEKGNWTLI